MPPAFVDGSLLRSTLSVIRQEQRSGCLPMTRVNGGFDKSLTRNPASANDHHLPVAHASTPLAGLSLVIQPDRIAGAFSDALKVYADSTFFPERVLVSEA